MQIKVHNTEFFKNFNNFPNIKWEGCKPNNTSEILLYTVGIWIANIQFKTLIWIANFFLRFDRLFSPFIITAFIAWYSKGSLFRCPVIWQQASEKGTCIQTTIWIPNNNSINELEFWFSDAILITDHSTYKLLSTIQIQI